MVSQITLGNAFQSGGKTVVGGGQTGFDTESLIKALTDAKALPATTLTAKNKTISTQQDAYAKLKTLLSTFQSSVDSLRNPPGVNNAAKNVFQYRTSSIVSSDGSDASNYIGISVQPGAQTQSFTIDKITQLAQQTKQQSNTISVADTTTASVVSAAGTDDDGVFSAGTFTLKANDGGADVSITLNEGDTLQTVANRFNQNSSRTGIQVGIIQLGTGSYKLTFTGTNTGLANGFDVGSATTVTGDTGGVLNKMSFATQQSAQNAKLTIDGIDLERANNAIDDIYSGVTFTLKQKTVPATTTFTASVIPDTSIVSNAITAFADAYNNFKLFASTQSQRNADGTPADTAVLANDATLRNMMDLVNQEATRVIGGITGDNPKQLQDVGITFDNFAGDDKNPATRNILTVDTDKLKSALTANFKGVESFFQFGLTTDNPALAVFERTKNIEVTSLSIAIDTPINSYKATYTDASGSTVTVDLDATALEGGSGYSLKGKAGTALEGLTLLYASTANATINATITEGMGDRLYNTLNSFLDTTNGTLTQATKALTDQTTRNNDEITRINDQVATYRDQITQKYADLEAALSKANSLLSLLQAQSDARNSSGN